MICYICKNEFEYLQSLIVHFKVYHFLGPDSPYDCFEESCFQSFQCLSSFKRHIKSKHLNLPKTKYTLPNTLPIDNQTSMSQNVTTNEMSCSNNIVSDDTSNKFNFQEAVSALHLSAVKFVLSLHIKNSITFKNVLDIQELMTDFVSKPLADLIDNFVKNKVTDPLLLSSFKEVSSVVSNPFKLCNTEYRLMKWLSHEQYINPLTQITINKEVTSVHHNGEVVYDEHITKGLLMPLKFQFQRFFEHGNNFQLSLERLNYLNSSKKMTNFVQGDLWKNKIKNHGDKLVFPYFLYIDDLEINNPLGSHATFQSVSAIYYSFPLMENNSKLSNIFLAALIKSVDLKKYGNEQCLKNVIYELRTLEDEGIVISTPGNINVNVHFILGLVLGDNLGLNSILEFSRSFSATFFCRFCKANKEHTKHMTQENPLLMRNINNYSQDVAKMDVTQTGIHKNSFLNNITSFHVTQNYCVDIMHDLFEGVCHYDMCHIIKYFTEVTKYFSLETLNLRKNNFNYGPIEIGNVSPSININHLNNHHLKMSAREMMTFVHFFSLMVGDLVPENDEVWAFFLNLTQIIDALLSHSVCETNLIFLRNLIKNHNEQYINLFHDSLKPKHHLLTHYRTIIKQSGPARHYWCFRFEAKHKELKLYAHATTSRRNITLALAKKMQVKFAYHLICPKPKNVIVNKTHEVRNNKQLELIRTLVLNQQFKCYTQIDYKGTLYKTDFYVTKVTDKLHLYKILQIIIFDSEEYMLAVQDIKLNYFHSHFDAYVVDENLTVLNNICVYKIEDFSGPPINTVRLVNGQIMIRLKENY